MVNKITSLPTPGVSLPKLAVIVVSPGPGASALVHHDTMAGVNTAANVADTDVLRIYIRHSHTDTLAITLMRQIGRQIHTLTNTDGLADSITDVKTDKTSGCRTIISEQ